MCSINKISKTIYDIAPQLVQFATQIIPTESYTVTVNGLSYTYIALHGYSPSQNIEKAKSNKKNTKESIHVTFSCTQEESMNDVLNDCLFLLLAYSITFLENLTLQEIDCVVELAEHYSLPLQYTNVVDSTSRIVQNVDDFYAVLQRIPTLYPFLEGESVSLETLAMTLTVHTNALIQNTLEPESTFLRILLACIFCWPLGVNESMNLYWKELLLSGVAQSIASERGIDSALLQSFIALMSKQAVDMALSIVDTNNPFPSLESLENEIRVSKEPIPSLFKEFQSETKKLYNTIVQSVHDRVHKAAIRLFLQWFSKQPPLDCKIEYSKGLYIHYSSLEYDSIQSMYYSIQECNGSLYKVEQPDVQNILHKADKIFVRLNESIQWKYGIVNCANPLVPLQVQYPFAVLDCKIPYDAYNQYQGCILVTDLTKLIEKAQQCNATIGNIEQAIV